MGSTMPSSENLPWACERADLPISESVTEDEAERVMRAWNHNAGALNKKDQKELWHYIITLWWVRSSGVSPDGHPFCKTFFHPKTGDFDPLSVTLPRWILYTAITSSCCPEMKAAVIEEHGESWFNRFDMICPSKAESSAPASQRSHELVQSKIAEAKIPVVTQLETGLENFEALKGDLEMTHSISSLTNDLADKLVQFTMQLHQHRQDSQKLQRTCDSLLKAMGDKVKKNP